MIMSTSSYSIILGPRRLANLREFLPRPKSKEPPLARRSGSFAADGRDKEVS
jgi:hypothetical protein